MAAQNVQFIIWDGTKQKRIDSESTELKLGKVSVGVLGDVEAAFSQEASDRVAGDAATLAAAQAYADAASAGSVAQLVSDVADLQSDLAQELLDRASGDASTLSSAQAYADQKISDLVGAAPSTLNTLKEIADAIANDASIAATLTAQIGQVQTNLTSEISARQSADSSLQSSISTVAAGLAQELLDRAAAVSGEASARASADSALQTSISGLSSDLATEVTARQSADSALQSSINGVAADLASEASARQSADTSLQSSINTVAASLASEASARAAADTALAGSISTVSTGLAQEISDRQAAVSGEASARVAGDAATLASAQSYADGKVAALVASAPAVLDTLKELADALGQDPNFATTVANNIGAVSSALSTETSRAQAAEASLQSAISAEASARAAAVASVQGEVDALELVVADLKLVSLVASEAISAGQICYIKSNGQAAKAVASVDLSDAHLVIAAASIAASAAGKFHIVEGSVVGGFSGLTPGKKYFVSASTAGAVVVNTAGFATGNSVYTVGRAVSATQIAFAPVFEFEY